MATETTTTDTDKAVAPSLPPEWQERARQAAKRYNLPPSTDDESPEEVERRLRRAEQRGGQ